jgi:HK97 family phage major capsid protein
MTATAAPSNGTTLNLPKRFSTEYEKAFRHLLRTGLVEAPLQQVHAPVDTRALGTPLGTTGGFITTEGFDALVLQAASSVDPMRQLCTVRSAPQGNTAGALMDDTTSEGELLTENGAVTELDVSFRAIVPPTYMFSSRHLIRVPWSLLQDSAPNIEQLLADLLGGRVGRIENRLFTNGSGAGEPQGLLQTVTVGVTGAVGQTATVAWDDLINLQDAVSEGYRFAGARYMMASSTLTKIKRLVGGDGQQLWKSDPSGNTPAGTIDGYPVTINPAMPAMAASAKSILFGNFENGYLIRDVSDSGILIVNKELYAGSLQTAFCYVHRTGGEQPRFASVVPVACYQNSET